MFGLNDVICISLIVDCPVKMCKVTVFSLARFASNPVATVKFGKCFAEFLIPIALLYKLVC